MIIPIGDSYNKKYPKHFFGKRYNPPEGKYIKQTLSAACPYNQQ